MTEPPLEVVLVDRRHRRDCAVWTVEGPWDCTCGLEPPPPDATIVDLHVHAEVRVDEVTTPR